MLDEETKKRIQEEEDLRHELRTKKDRKSFRLWFFYCSRNFPCYVFYKSENNHLVFRRMVESGTLGS